MCEISMNDFFFKQKTAYEMRISDWSSDVCSSDLPGVSQLALRPGKSSSPSLGGKRRAGDRGRSQARFRQHVGRKADGAPAEGRCEAQLPADRRGLRIDRKSTRLNSSH